MFNRGKLVKKSYDIFFFLLFPGIRVCQHLVGKLKVCWQISEKNITNKGSVRSVARLKLNLSSK